MLRPLAPDLWVQDHPQTFWGAQLGTRMIVARLESGALWLHAPVPIDDALAAELAALGPVAAIVAPNGYHHLYVAAAAARYPDAACFAAPGLAARGQPALGEVLTDRAPELWRHQIDQEVIKGAPGVGEVVFFHRESKTLLLTDLLFHVTASPSWWTRTFLQLAGAYGTLGMCSLYRRAIQDPAATRTSVDRILMWDFDRVTRCHGDLLETGGRMRVAEALATLG